MLLARCVRICCLALFAAASVLAQTHPKASLPAQTGTPANATVVLLSDLHLDVFHDPGKFAHLLTANASDWPLILNTPDTPTMAADTARLNTACPVRGTDTPPALLASALAAAHHTAPDALFAVVDGDLLAHAFDCRFQQLAPKATADQYSAFATKTATFIALQLHATFGATPVYVGLGNNDSGCGDYRESSNSAFLRTLAASLAQQLTPANAGDSFATQYDLDGSYSVRLPAPIARGRLIVVQDLFQSAIYKTCADQPDTTAPKAQIAWLSAQLAAARAAHEQVWFMAHIPPGINVYTTFAQRRDVCGASGQPQEPVAFLANDELTRTLTSYADVVRLAIFAHTHNDEIQLLRPDPADNQAVAEIGVPLPGPVAAKLTPSISPVNGNLPAFTVAQVNRQSAVLEDYRVVVASNQTGVSTHWADEYQFSQLYGMHGYTPANVAKLTDAFIADKSGSAKLSNDFAQMFFPGGGKGTLAVHLLWTQYSCGFENHTAATYRACVCPAR